MGAVIHLDTHVVAWLYAGELDRFPESVREQLDTSALAICPMVALELQYLFEIGRVAAPAAEVVGELRRTIGLRIAASNWMRAVDRALGLDFTRDPFDRLIAACAIVDDVPLVTKDSQLRAHCANAVWG